MSNEATTWALNLAPVPTDSSGTPSGACASVLIGLANHADPDGTGAFPSVSTLVRYTRLSERTVRACLDRLEDCGVIKPSSDAIVAAKIPRADRRPKCYDLDMSRVRDDLSDQEMERIANSNKFLRPIIMEWFRNRAAASDGVQLTQERGATDAGTGCNWRKNGVQLTQERGAAAAPELSNKPSNKPSKKIGAAAPVSPDMFGNTQPGSCTYSEFKIWCHSVKRAVVPDDHAIWTWSETVGLPTEYLELAFAVFDARFTADEKARRKKYKDWPDAFMNYVKRDYLRLWYLDRDRQYQLTTVGQQAKLEHFPQRHAA